MNQIVERVKKLYNLRIAQNALENELLVEIARYNDGGYRRNPAEVEERPDERISALKLAILDCKLAIGKLVNQLNILIDDGVGEVIVLRGENGGKMIVRKNANGDHTAHLWQR